jgi:hypothetical protein
VLCAAASAARTAAVLFVLACLSGCAVDRSPLLSPAFDSAAGSAGAGSAGNGGEDGTDPNADAGPGQRDGSTDTLIPGADASEQDASGPHPPEDAAIADTGPLDTGPLDTGPADAGDSGPVPDGAQDADSDDAGTVLPRCTGGASQVTVNATIVVASGETFDGECRRYVAGGALASGGSPSELPLFHLQHGARLINVMLGWPAADGVHTYGDVTLANIVWTRIADDALTIKESGTVQIEGGSAQNSDNTVIQINAASTFRVLDFDASNAGKFIRQNGGTTFRVDVFIDRCDISDMVESIFRTDSNTTTVTMTDTRYHNIGGELFMGVNPSNITASGNTEY